MLLSARMLNGVTSANAFDYTQTFQLTQGDQQDVYLQLTDISKMPPTQYFFPAGLRYAPQVGATLKCTLQSIDDARTLSRFATQPFPTLDPSIWKLSILSTDSIGAGTFALQLALTEGVVTLRGVLQAAVQIVPTSSFAC